MIRQLSIAAAFLLGASPLNAAIIDSGTFFTDTSTGLDWLQLSETTGLTQQQVSDQFGEWRYAKGSEFISLLEEVNVGYPGNLDYLTNSLSPAAINPFDLTFSVRYQDYVINRLFDDAPVLSQALIDAGFTVKYQSSSDAYLVSGSTSVGRDLLLDQYLDGSPTNEELDLLGPIFDTEQYSGSIGFLMDNLGGMGLSEIVIASGSAGGGSTGILSYADQSAFRNVFLNGRRDIGGNGSGYYLVRGGVTEVPIPAALFMFGPTLLGFMVARRKI